MLKPPLSHRSARIPCACVTTRLAPERPKSIIAHIRHRVRARQSAWWLARVHLRRPASISTHTSRSIRTASTRTPEKVPAQLPAELPFELPIWLPFQLLRKHPFRHLRSDLLAFRRAVSQSSTLRRPAPPVRLPTWKTSAHRDGRSGHLLQASISGIRADAFRCRPWPAGEVASVEAAEVLRWRLGYGPITPLGGARFIGWKASARRSRVGTSSRTCFDSWLGGRRCASLACRMYARGDGRSDASGAPSVAPGWPPHAMLVGWSNGRAQRRRPGSRSAALRDPCRLPGWITANSPAEQIAGHRERRRNSARMASAVDA